MAIPKRFTERYLQKAEGGSFFGVKIEDMTRDELIAMAMNANEKLNGDRIEHSRQLGFLRSIRLASS